MKTTILILLIACCAGCQLTEYRSTAKTQHIYSQADNRSYFSNCRITTRADSFKLAEKQFYFRFFGLPNLSDTPVNAIRLYYIRSFHAPYFVTIEANGKVTIITTDSSAPREMYQHRNWDTAYFSPHEREVYSINKLARYYTRKQYADSLAWLNKLHPGIIDSLYYDYLDNSAYMQQPMHDTISMMRTTFFIDATFYKQMAANLDSIRFWQKPIEEYGGGMDGSEWTLEATISHQHHICSTDNIAISEDMRKLCEKMLALTDIPPKDIY